MQSGTDQETGKWYDRMSYYVGDFSLVDHIKEEEGPEGYFGLVPLDDGTVYSLAARFVDGVPQDTVTAQLRRVPYLSADGQLHIPAPDTTIHPDGIVDIDGHQIGKIEAGGDMPIYIGLVWYHNKLRYEVVPVLAKGTDEAAAAK